MTERKEGGKYNVVDVYNAFAPWYDVMYAAQGRRAQDCIYNPDVAKAYAKLFQDMQVLEILDCACGTGDPLLGIFNEGSGSCRLVGCDGSKVMLDSCGRNASMLGVPVHKGGSISAEGGVELVEQPCRWEALRATYGDRRFDVVMCCGHALYHQVTRNAILSALEGMTAVTRKDGYVIFDSLRWQDDLRAEVQRPNVKDLVKWRGWTVHEGRRVMFLDSSTYVDDESAVSGTLQVKQFYVLEEDEGDLRQVGGFRFRGAPFNVKTALELLSQTGLVDVHEVRFDETTAADHMRRYFTVAGRKP